jgi:hypothetical protein
MTYDEAVAEVARRRGCKPEELCVCLEDGKGQCQAAGGNEVCDEVWALMRLDPRIEYNRACSESVGAEMQRRIDGAIVDVLTAPYEGAPQPADPYAAVAEGWGRIPAPARGILPDDDKARLDYPMADGLLYYFPAALAEVARVSKIGNDQHNPGQPLHWARGKSTDHENKILRHLVEAGTKDSKGVRHSARLAWRALALLQVELEREEGAPFPKNAKY